MVLYQRMLELIKGIDMRIHAFPHAPWRNGACLSLLCAALLLQGCSDDSDPYAELDSRFPEGRPGIASVEERANDRSYQQQMIAASKAFAARSDAVATAKKATEAYVKVISETWKKNYHAEQVPAAMLAQRLAEDDHYKELLKAQQEAEAACEQLRTANMKLIRDRMNAPVVAYETMAAAADAAAQKAGKPTRQQLAAQKAQVEQKQKIATARQDLSSRQQLSNGAASAPSAVPPMTAEQLKAKALGQSKKSNSNL
ncbi:MAG: hypothetical protein RR268_02605 [Kiritimatiellia bacterium]